MQNYFCSEGNVGNNFELKTVPSKNSDNEYKVLNFSLRCAVQTKTESGYKDTGGFWVSVEYWGVRAEMIHTLLKKGVRLFVIGELSEDSFVASKGEHVGETITQRKVKAESISFSPLGIDAITYTPKSERAPDQPPSLPGGHASQEVDNEFPL